MEPGAPAAAPSEATGRMTVSLVQISLSREFAASVPGILRLAEMILSMVAFICAAAARIDVCDFLHGSTYNFFEFVSISAFLTGLLLYAVWILTLQEKFCFKFLPWTYILLGWLGFYAVFYLIGSSVIAAHACSQAGNAAAAVFGFMTLVVFGLDLAMAIRDFRQTRQSGAATKEPETIDPPPQY